MPTSLRLFVIVTSTTPADAAVGVVAVIDVVELTVKLAALLPNFTLVIFEKFEPVIVILSPPAVEPLTVPMDVTVGAVASTEGESHTDTMSNKTMTGTMTRQSFLHIPTVFELMSAPTYYLFR